MTTQTRTISVQEVQERLPALLEMACSRKERFVIEDEGMPIAMLVAAENREEEGARPHIGRVEGVCGGEPIILGTRISVTRIVELFQDSGSIDEILDALPHLTPAQVHAALTYYYDNQEEIEQLLKQRTLEYVVKKHNLVLDEIADGIYLAHDADGKW